MDLIYYLITAVDASSVYKMYDFWLAWGKSITASNRLGFLCMFYFDLKTRRFGICFAYLVAERMVPNCILEFLVFKDIIFLVFERILGDF